MRSALPLAALAALALAPSASAQDAGRADSVAASARPATPPAPRGTVTVPLPNGRGVFYYRAGEPGGVRIRSRNGTRPPGPAPAPQAAPARGEAAGTSVEVVVPERAAPAGDGISRLDLLLLERNLIEAIDRRLDALALGLRDDRSDRPYLPLAPSPQSETIVVPGRPAAPAAPLAPGAPTTQTPRPPTAEPIRPVAPVQPLDPADPIVIEVERAILETGLLVTNRVNFEFGEATLIPVSEQLLRTIGDVLLRYPDLRVRVGGHTDAVSSAAYNLRLSQRRADTVRDFLIGYGVEAGRLEAVGYGEGEPIASNETETGRALNRRVEFTVLNPEVAEPRPVPADDEADALRRVIREELERLRDDG